MPRSKIADLNDHLFDQLSRLNKEGITPEELEIEIQRANAVSGIASNIVAMAKVSVDALKLVGKGDLTKGDVSALFLQNQIGN